MKVCSKCRKAKELSAFAKNRTKKDGRSVICKVCHRAYNQAHYRGNRPYYIKKALRRNGQQLKELTDLVNEVKNRPCVDCGRKFHPCAMDLDHVRGEKLQSVSFMRSQKFSVVRVQAEIAKCEVRCAVCHRLRTNGISPDR